MFEKERGGRERGRKRERDLQLRKELRSPSFDTIISFLLQCLPDSLLFLNFDIHLEDLKPPGIGDVPSGESL